MKLLIVAIVLMTAGCVGLNNWHASNVSKGNDATIILDIDNKVIIPGQGERTIDFKAIAIPLNRKYVLALKHCVVQEKFIKYRMFGMWATLPIKVLKNEVTHNGQSLKLIKTHGDLALMRYEGTLTPFPFKWGDSDKVRLGDKVLVLGFSFAKCKVIKDGIISALGALTYHEGDECFIHTVPTNPGDSGSPMLTWQDGELKIIGIVNAMIRDNGLGFAIKSNEVRKLINGL